MTTPNQSEAPKISPGTPCWIHIPAHDLSRCINFYKTALNFTITPNTFDEGPKMAFFNFPGSPFANTLSGGIIERPAEANFNDVPAEKGPAVLYFYAHDLEDTLSEIVRLGGKVTQERCQVPGGWSADFRDTEGNFHGIFTSNEKKE